MPKTAGDTFSQIMLATDGSPNSQRAAEVGAQIAKAFESEVTVLVAIPSANALAAPPEGEYYSQLISKADGSAHSAAEVFKKAGVTSVTESEVPRGRGSVVGTIVEQAAEKKTGLIVLGTRGLGGLKRMVIGSVSSGVAAHAPCATLVVRSGKKGRSGPQSIRSVLVAVDGSENAQRALEVSVELAKRLRAELRIAHVVYIPTLVWSMGVPGSAVPTDRMQEDAEKAARQLLEKAAAFAEDAGVADPKQELVTDVVSPAQGVVQLAERDRVDVVVVGTRGNGGFKKLLLGSVANSVLHYADCSVLVTR